MKPTVKHTACILMLLAATLTCSAYAASASSGAGDQPAASKAAKKAAKNSKAGRVSQIKFLPGSEETARERSTRLKRECKGRVNAGACEGYTN